MEALIASSVQILIALGGAYILTLWFAIVVWTFQDIQARSRSVVAQIFSTLVVLIFSIPGLLIYLILRPRYTLDDAFQRSLEEEYLMQDLEELPLCPGCQQYVEDEWVFCPNCRTELRDNCIACNQLIDLRWEICPYCGTEQYEDEDEMLPPPVMKPVMAPTPQFLGRPQMTQTDVYRLQDASQRTRPIIPATVRVDLRNGDVLTEAVPGLPISSPLHSIDRLVEPRRVKLSENGGVHLSGEEDKPVAPGVDSSMPEDEDARGTGAPEPVDSSADPDVDPSVQSDLDTTALISDDDGSERESAEPSATMDTADNNEEGTRITSEGTTVEEAEDPPAAEPKKRRKRRRKAQ